MKIIYQNKKFFVDFEIIEKFVAGISLLGWEVKSIKLGKFDLTNSFILIKNSEVKIKNFKIVVPKSLLQFGNNLEERDKILLLKRKEIVKIQTLLNNRGLTVVPINVFLNDKGLIKLTIAVVRAIKKYDKREQKKKKELQKEFSRVSRKFF